MINVLHTIDTTGPGGAERVFRELAVRADPARFRPHVAVNGPGWLHDDLLRHGLTPLRLPAKGETGRLGYLRALVALVRRLDIQVVQAHLLGAALYGSLTTLLTGVPVVATLHGTVDLGPATDRLATLKCHLVGRGARRIVFVSDYLRRHFARTTPLAGRNCLRIYNGIDLARYRRADGGHLRRELGLGPGDTLVGAVGNIRPAKGYDVLLRAAARLRGHGPRFKFVIAGDGGRGGLLDELLALRRQLGLEQDVVFLGYRDDTAALLSQLDLYVLASTSEGLSIATLEAMACAVPVVCTRSGGPEELVRHGETGLLVPPGDPEALAEALLRLAGHPAQARRLADAGQRFAHANFDVRHMVDAYGALYETLAAGRRRAA